MEDRSSNIVTRFLEAAAGVPEEIALIQDKESVTYRQLAQDVAWTAGRFQRKGIQKGDRVLVFVPMSIDLYRTVLALLQLGACPVFLDEWVSLDRLKACLRTVPCKGMIAGWKHRVMAMFIPSLRRIPVRISAASGTDNDRSIPTSAVDPQSTALVTFTTGSTGIPKAADRTHAFLQAQLEALDPLLAGISGPCLTTLPIVVLLHLARGRATLLPPLKFKATKPDTMELLGNSLQLEAPRSIIMSPAVVESLVVWLHQHGNGETQVSAVLTGGGPVYPDLAARLIHAFPQAKITAVYGSTEAEPISHIDAKLLAGTDIETFLNQGLPVGHPDAAAAVRILAPAAISTAIRTTEDLVSNLVQDEAPGEIIVSGAHVLRHYINNPLAEASIKIRVDQQVWHRTGDCGRIGTDGNLYLLGRVAEAIEWQGRQVYPAVLGYLLRVEAAIQISALLLEKGALLLILEEKFRHLAEAGLAALLRRGIFDATVRFVHKIPRDPRHRTKVDYTALRDLIR